MDPISTYQSTTPALTPALKEVIKLLSTYNFFELQELLLKIIEKCPDFRPEIVSYDVDKLALFKVTYDQLKLNTKLKDFGFPVTNQQENPQANCHRIIITTEDVSDGLDFIFKYLKVKPGSDTAQKIQELTAEDVLNHFTDKMEIAWGLLGGLLKHQNESPFVTASFAIAKIIIPKTNKKTTLVLDGHGGKGQVCFAECRTLGVEELEKKITSLIGCDTGRNIDHVVLQSCTSGTLNPDSIASVYRKNNTRPGKGRSIVIPVIKTDVEVPLFNKRDGKALTVAEAVYNALRNRKDVAFTFSENPINPSALLGDGNIGVPASSLPSAERPKWPHNLETNAATVKSTTVIHSLEHRKFDKESLRFFQEASTSGPSEETPAAQPKNDK